MFKTSRLVLVFTVGLLLVSPALAQIDENGYHFNLNLLGKNKCPGDDLKDTGRHTIMVKLSYSDPDPDPIIGNDVCAEGTENPDCYVSLDRTNKIFLARGDFAVIDGNACDSDGAKFQLPAPEDMTYEIFVRELGKPGGKGDLRTCGVYAGPDGIKDTADDELVCSTENVLLVRSTGKSIWRKVTTELTTLTIGSDTDLNGVLDPSEEMTVSIFDGLLWQYYWDYDNNGLRLVQLRFYPVQQ